MAHFTSVKWSENDKRKTGLTKNVSMKQVQVTNSLNGWDGSECKFPSRGKWWKNFVIERFLHVIGVAITCIVIVRSYAVYKREICYWYHSIFIQCIVWFPGLLLLHALRSGSGEFFKDVGYIPCYSSLKVKLSSISEWFYMADIRNWSSREENDSERLISVY